MTISGGDADPKPRPYVLTAGRVRAADPGIGVETQVVAGTDSHRLVLSPAQAAIVDACPTPLSVAEIAVRVGLHLNVTRVLVGDLRAAGAVAVHTAGTHSPDDILRVMRGLRAIV